MIENSPLGQRQVSQKFEKLQKASSDHRFRVKSLRVKTHSNDMEDHINTRFGLPLIKPSHSHQKIVSATKLGLQKDQSMSLLRSKLQSSKVIQKNYERQLNTVGVDSTFLRTLFACKCEENDFNPTEQRYQSFVKNLAIRFCDKSHVVVSQMGFGPETLRMFLEWLIEWQGHIKEIDFSLSEQLLQQAKNSLIMEVIRKSPIMKLIVCNCHLSSNDLTLLLRSVVERQQLFSLDISNHNSQALNRFGEGMEILEQFAKNNTSVGIMKVANMQLKREGLEYLSKGLSVRKVQPLRILDISNNYIKGSAVCDSFINLIRSGVTHLNLSSNPLGDDFYRTLPTFKGTTVKDLNLSQTDMNSHNFYQLLHKIEQVKSLTILRVNGNDFSHHWFGKVGQKLETNSSLQQLCLNDCQIKTYLPIFEGLVQNKYLQRLQANNNIVDCEKDLPTKMADCFTFNKELEEVSLRFCNLNEEVLQRMFVGLTNNKKVKRVDVSENLMGDQGGRAILKMLDHNSKIEYMGIDKLQFSQPMRRRIQLKLEETRSVRKKSEFVSLVKTTKEIKSKDKYTWEDLEEYEAEIKKLDRTESKYTDRVELLESRLEVQRKKLAETRKTCKEQEAKAEAKMKNGLRSENQKMMRAEKQVAKLTKKENKIQQDTAQELRAIEQLEQRIKEHMELIAARENQLQDLYRDKKYLKKKEEGGTGRRKSSMSQPAWKKPPVRP